MATDPAIQYTPAVHEYKYEIDTTPNGTTRTWATLGAGLDQSKGSDKDKTETNQYLSDKGFSRTEVYGTEEQYAFSGKRVPGDTAQDYIFSEPVRHAFGKARHTFFRVTNPIGDMLEWDATLANITDTGGKTVSGSDISFDVMLNGAPAYTAHTA